MNENRTSYRSYRLYELTGSVYKLVPHFREHFQELPRVGHLTTQIADTQYTWVSIHE